MAKLKESSFLDSLFAFCLRSICLTILLLAAAAVVLELLLMLISHVASALPGTKMEEVFVASYWYLISDFSVFLFFFILP